MYLPQTVDLACPHCKRAIRVCVPEKTSFMDRAFELVSCDKEYGGCGKTYAVEIDFVPTVKVFILEERPSPSTPVKPPFDVSSEDELDFDSITEEIAPT